MLALVGLSAVLAVVGGGIYILVTVWSIFLGKKLESGARSNRAVILRMPVAEAVEGYGGGVGVLEAKGTFTLALVFLAVFVLYYFINWKYLSEVWGLS
jgi:cytochrome c oxidase subunit 1